MNNSNNTLWVEKYRPNNLNDYVGNDIIKARLQTWIDTQDVPHILLYGKPGCGKSTIFHILVNNIECDYLYINASDENSVDTVRDKIKGFVSTIGFKKWKFVILDEFDFMTQSAMASLRNMMEVFSDNCRFILTCNYVEKVIDAIVSRCQVFEIHPPSMVDVAKRLKLILDSENITYTNIELSKIVKMSYPDIRKTISTAQSMIKDNAIIFSDSKFNTDNFTLIDNLLLSKSNKSTKITEIRQLIADNKIRTFEDFYKYLYDNVDKLFPQTVSETLIAIAQYQYMDAFVVDKEINFVALMANIIQ